MTRARRNHHAAHLADKQPIHTGLDRFVDSWTGRRPRRLALLRNWQRQAREIRDASEQLGSLSDKELSSRLQQLKALVRRHQRLPDERLIEGFALIVEAAARSIQMRAYEVQIVGALALEQGFVAEMATGEGKTLTAALALVVSGWVGLPCHLITANEYLALRDALRLKPFFAFCGLSVGGVTASMEATERCRAYSQDIVYITAKELLADFLRDRLLHLDSPNAEQRNIRSLLKGRVRGRSPVTRGIYRAIVDEADSVLIDEAITPLILSQAHQVPSVEQACRQAFALAEQMIEKQDYKIDQRRRTVQLAAAGKLRAQEWSRDLPPFYRPRERHRELVLTALTANIFFQRDVDYLIDEDRVVIVDELTGRMMPDRSWRLGLQQAIEVREQLPVTDPSETLAQMSFQNFFRRFERLSGLTGTAKETASELWTIYRLPLATIPLNRPSLRQRNPISLHLSKADRWRAICGDIEQSYASRQPVLVGTRSIADSQHLAAQLVARQLPFNLLNAIQHQEEAAIIATAGQQGQITIATNMAGRGADILLGPGVCELGGLKVILSEPHESKRIDRQLEGRCARQGLPGIVCYYSSSEDSLLMKYLPAPLRLLLQYLSGCERSGSYMAQKLVRLAQWRACKDAERRRIRVLQQDAGLSEMLPFN
jgi:preprotein translocase subunit SecA